MFEHEILFRDDMLQGILQRATKTDRQVWTWNITVGMICCTEFYEEQPKMTDKFEHELLFRDDMLQGILRRATKTDRQVWTWNISIGLICWLVI